MGQHTSSYSTSRWNGSLRRAALAISLGLLVGMTMAQPEAAQAQTFSVLHAFNYNDGAEPTAGLTIGGAGTFYGTAGIGGSKGGGVAFKLAQRGSGWTLTPLYDFALDANYLPAAGLTIGPGGALYGTTTNDGGYGA
ncbi:MAG: choice-of-anchor tandem repeat GloVer-containing protein, partial [Candidatus Korobacteraceae bacterium]